jgi:hypothetical protein
MTYALTISLRILHKHRSAHDRWPKQVAPCNLGPTQIPIVIFQYEMPFVISSVTCENGYRPHSLRQPVVTNLPGDIVQLPDNLCPGSTPDRGKRDMIEVTIVHVH